MLVVCFCSVSKLKYRLGRFVVLPDKYLLTLWRIGVLSKRRNCSAREIQLCVLCCGGCRGEGNLDSALKFKYFIQAVAF